MFRLNKHGELRYYTIDAFERTGLVRHCFTTRCGGVSSGIYESMNLRLNCDDSRENVIENLRIICEEIGINPSNSVFSRQIHETRVQAVSAADRGNGLLFENKFESADALITNESNVALVTFFADCVPIYFLDAKNRVIALAHSGWRGTADNIAAEVVKKFVSQYGSSTENILAAIGPSIGECHFEVGEEIAEIFRSRCGEDTVTHTNGRPHVNLQRAVKKQLLSLGIPEKNITVADICTYCNSELLFSHRKTNGKRGNLAAIMELA